MGWPVWVFIDIGCFAVSPEPRLKSLAEHLRYPRRIYRLPYQDWLHGFVLHVLTGVAAVLAHYVVMWLLVAAELGVVVASSIGFVAGAGVRFFLSYTKVFTPSDAVPVTLGRFVAALGLQFLGNMAVLRGLLLLGLSIWVAQVVTTLLLTAVNYVMYRLWVFR